jgi:DeoR family transcriptional regulator, fructose operon transcriptional repressor
MTPSIRKEPILLNERQRNIIDMVEKNGAVRVAELSSHFKVSEETIRRDLEKLESENFLKRIHGGAVKCAPKEGVEIPVFKRQATYMEEKTMIAKKAATFVEDGDIIAIDASTTALQMTKYLHGKSLTIITNSIPVTLELIHESNMEVILIGGYVNGDSMSLVGNFAERVIADYHVDKLFFSGMGVDVNRGISEIHEQQALVKKQLFSISEEKYLLADHSKFGQKSLIKLCNLQDIDVLITDKKVPIERVGELKRKGVQMIIAD